MHVGCGVGLLVLTAVLQVRLSTADFEVPSKKRPDTGPYGYSRFLRFLSKEACFPL